MNTTEAPNIVQSFVNSENMEFKINDKKFQFYLSYNQNIIVFKVFSIDLIIQNELELTLTLEQLYKINRFFNNFETIKEIVDWI
jgi:c-di-AMP phosphodiesterase-like protein